MSMPKWAKVAATRLSDAQLASIQEREATLNPGQGPEASALANTREATASLIVEKSEDGGETVGGTVSRKGKFGFVCEKCHFVPKKSSKPDWVSWKINHRQYKCVGLHFPHRCNKCKSRMKRWTCAARNYDQLEILRTLEGRHCLRFITFTREEWNVKVPVVYGVTSPSDQQKSDATAGTPPTLWGEAEKLKKMATRQSRN